MVSVPLQSTAGQELRPSGEEWEYEFIGGITGGIDTTRSPRSLEKEKVLTAENLRLFKNALVADLGFSDFTQSAILGIPRLTFQFFKNDGTSFLTLLTNKTFYTWNTTLEEFEYVDGGGSTTLSANEALGETTLSVNDETGFSAGDLVGIRLNDGTQHRTTVASTAAGTITVDDGLPSAADSGNEVTRPEHLSGSDDIQPSVTTWAGTDKMYFTNGVDALKSFDGVIISDVSGLPANFKCRLVEVDTNHLIVCNTEESGVQHPQRERWSEPGSDSDWNTSVNFQDHVDTEDRIVAIERLGIYTILYKERSLIRQEFIGTAEQTWNWTTTIGGEGAIAEDAVVNLGDEHIFWGNSNIYSYRGGFDIEPVGDDIFDGVFSTASGDRNPENAGRTFGIYVEEFDEAWFFYPVSGDTFPTRQAKLHLQNRSWTFRTFGFAVSGFGFFSTVGAVTWSQFGGSWEGATSPWVSSAVQAEAPTVHLLDGTNIKIYEYDFLASDDNGVNIPVEVETKDFFVPNRKLRFDRYDFFIRGNSIAISASYDGGENFQTLGTVSPGTSFATITLYKQVVAASVRFRLTGIQGFGLETIGFAFKRESLV